MKKYNLLFIILLLNSLMFVSAGVSVLYHKDYPLELAPGESKDVQMILQNMVGNKDITLRAEIVEGSEIAHITDSNPEYFIPFGREDIKVNLKVEIPENTPLNKEYQIKVSFKQVSQDSEGKMIQMTSGIEKAFPVLITNTIKDIKEEKPSKSTFLYQVAIIILIIILIISAFFIKKRNSY